LETCEEADNIKGIASISNQKCKIYKTFSMIIVVLLHEPKFSAESQKRCYKCTGTACRDPYTPRPEHEARCNPEESFCVKIVVGGSGK